MRNINASLLGKRRTSIFIAHRLRTVAEAGTSAIVILPAKDVISNKPTDIIFVLKEGQVVEQGTHDELMRMKGLYYSMWMEQQADIFAEESPEVSQ